MNFELLEPKNPRAGINIGNKFISFGEIKPKDREFYIKKFKLENQFYLPMEVYVVVMNNKIIGVDNDNPTYLMGGRIKLSDRILNGVNYDNSKVFKIRGKRIPDVGENYSDFLKNASPASNYKYNGKVISFDNKAKTEEEVKVKIYQIYFNSQSFYKCNNIFDLYKNENANHWLENDAIQKIGKLQSWNDSDFVGSVSYRWHDKCPRLDTSIVANRMAKNIDADVFSLYSHKRGNPIKIGYNHHRNLKYLFNAVLGDYCGFSPKAFNDQYNYGYCNFWVAKKSVWEHYLLWASDLMEWVDKKAPEIIRQKFNENAGYEQRKPKDWYLRIFKQPHYTHHPFFMERAVNAFFYENGYYMETMG